MALPTSPFPYIVVALALVAAIIFASGRKGSVASTRLGTRRLELHLPIEPAAAFALLTGMSGRYKVDDSDAASRIVILSSRPTFATWGFFYPIIVHAAGTGSRLEIGIRSKLVQGGPLVGRAHKHCVAAIEELTVLPVARVA